MELSCTHLGGLDADHYTAILVWPEEEGVAVGHVLAHSMDHVRRMTLVVEEEEVAVLLEIVLHCYRTFPALVATAESAVVHRSAVTPSSAAVFVLAWR